MPNLADGFKQLTYHGTLLFKKRNDLLEGPMKKRYNYGKETGVFQFFHGEEALTMARMAVLVPYRELLGLAEEMLAEHKSITRHSVVYLGTDEVEAYARTLESEGCDIIMARGLYARLARQATRLPVVEIRVTAQELGELVLDIQEELGVKGCRVGLIGEALMLSDTSSFLRLFRTEILRYEFANEPDAIGSIRAAVRRAAADGCQAVIGGRTVCREAEKAGLCFRFMYAGRESLRNAFDMAKHVAYAIDQEKSSRAEIETMLDFTFSGIVRVDPEGTVLWANAIACDLLGRFPQELLGKKIVETFPTLKAETLDKALVKEEEAYTILVPPSRRETVVNIAPIRVEQRLTGAILTFQEGRRIIEMSSELRQELYLQGFLAHWQFDHLPARSQEGRRMIQQAGLVAKYSAPVLLIGETGSGKEILAQCIHNAGVTRGNAFIPLDCRAYHPDTLDTMLFGHYSVRKETPSSMVEIAQNGTIYLAHVEALTQELQYKLLRLIRGHFMHNGSNRAVEADVRIIASTDVNLIARVERGEFRSDLYYELNALGISSSPLRERRDDILEWVELYLSQWEKRYDRRVQLSKGARDYLREYDWPGNLDQIRSVCEQIVLLSERRSVDEGFLRRRIEQLTPKLLPGTEQMVIYKDEKAMKIAALLREYGGNRQKVADALGVSKTTLWRYMKKYGIDKDFNY